MGNYDKALDAFNKVFDFPKTNKLPDAHLKIGLIYEKTGKVDQAKEELKAVVSNYPGTDAAGMAAARLKTLGE
jgi:TolA-binding protein